MGESRWQVLIHRKAEKTLKRFHGEAQERIRHAIQGLAEDPIPVGYKKLTGSDNLYRLRLGSWRISYAIEDDKLIVLVLQVAQRGGAYREL